MPVPTSVPTSRSEVGTRIKAVAEQLGTRVEAAEIAGISTDQLARYIVGEGEISLSPIAKLALAAGVSLDWIWCGDAVLKKPSSHHAAQESAHDGYVRAAEEVKSPAKIVRDLATEISFDGPTDALLMLVELMARDDISEAGARAVLKHVKVLLRGK